MKTTIRDIRERLGITQSEMAKKLNAKRVEVTIGDMRYITRQTICDWEHGRKQPDRLIQAALADIAK